MSSVVYLNGSFVPYDEAVVPVEDRGYLFADGVYEAVRFYNNRPFMLPEHLARLQRSAAAIRLSLPPVSELSEAVLQTVARNGCPDAVLYLQVTRGAAPRRHEFPPPGPPTVFMIARPYSRPDGDMLSKGVGCVSVPDLRWQMCHIKSTGLLLNVLAKQQAVEADAFEALFIRDGTVTEGTSCNVFMVNGRSLVTHPADQHILAGITRSVVLSLAQEMSIEVREESFTLPQLKAADEVFITSTGIEVLPVTTVDGETIGQGRTGPMTERLWQAYDRLVQKTIGS